MFEWLRGSGGLEEVGVLFQDMLVDGRHVFELALQVRLAERDAEDVADDLLETEERTDEAERRIRRLVLVHASTHRGFDLPTCLLYMSVSKDAERIADLSKSLFGVASVAGPAPPGSQRDELVRLRDSVAPMITEAADVFAHERVDRAEDFIARARVLQRNTRAHIDALLVGDDRHSQPAAAVLTSRHVGRIVANLLNIVSAVVVPLDQLDYPGTAPSP